MKTNTYNKSTVWFLSTPIQSLHNVQPPSGVVFFAHFSAYARVGHLFSLAASLRQWLIKTARRAYLSLPTPDRPIRPHGGLISHFRHRIEPIRPRGGLISHFRHRTEPIRPRDGLISHFRHRTGPIRPHGGLISHFRGSANSCFLMRSFLVAASASNVAD